MENKIDENIEKEIEKKLEKRLELKEVDSDNGIYRKKRDKSLEERKSSIVKTSLALIISIAIVMAVVKLWQMG